MALQLQCLIVDDEHLSRQYVRNLVLEFCPDCTIYEAQNVRQALTILANKKIDFVCLDIRMSQLDGFDLLGQITERNFEVIFVTAYSQYAINAIKHGAFDYILKPIKKSEFKETVLKVMDKCAQKQATLGGFKSKASEYYEMKLAVNHMHGTTLFTLKHILYLQANNTYTLIIQSNGSSVLVSKPIRWFEDTLKKPWFFRIHKSTIINCMHLRNYLSDNGYWAVMDNGERLVISRYRLQDFQEALKQLSCA